MKIKKYNNLYQLTRLGAFNAFFVQEDDGLTLVDTGLSGSAKAIVQAAAEIGSPIRRIVLTHAHGDHAGSLDALHTAVPQANILMGERTAQFLAGEKSLRADEPQEKLRGSFVQARTKPTALLQPDAMVGCLKIIASPGHTPDHLSFLDMRDGTLIAGDAFQTQAGTAVAGTMRWLFPFPAMATWHRETAVKSARALLEFQPQRLAVGHGKVLENPMEEMRKAIRVAEHG